MTKFKKIENNMTKFKKRKITPRTESFQEEKRGYYEFIICNIHNKFGGK